MAYHLRNNFGIERLVWSTAEVFEKMLFQATATTITFMMADRNIEAALEHWGTLYKTLDKDHQDSDLLADGYIFLQRLWETRDDWNYVAVNHPYTFRLTNQVVLVGTIPAIRVDKGQHRNHRRAEVLTFGWKKAASVSTHNDLVGVVNRMAYANEIKDEIRKSIRATSTVFIAIPECKPLSVLDDVNTRKKVKTYMKSIARGIAAKAFYPRHHYCRFCGYKPACDPRWADRESIQNPDKAAKRFRKLLEE